MSFKERQYLSNRDEVQSYVLSKNRDRDNRLEEARTRGLLRVCDCCASDDCLEDEMLSCEGKERGNSRDFFLRPFELGRYFLL